MASAYFAPLVLLPTIITAPGKYLTRSGAVVTVESASQKHDFRCVGTYPCGTREGWHKSGRIFAGCLTVNDIVAAA